MSELANVPEALPIGEAATLLCVDDESSILSWNPGAVRMYGRSEAEALLMNVRDRIPQGLREEALVQVHQLSRTEILKPCRTQRVCARRLRGWHGQFGRHRSLPDPIHLR